MKVTIAPSVAGGRVAAPASKSAAHRMMIGAALAEGESLLRGVAESEDLLATLDCLRALGAQAALENGALTVRGVGGDLSRSTGRFPCRESGSTLRFFVPLALLKQGTSLFTGSDRLMARGADVYAEVFAGKGITMEKTREGVAFTGRLAPGGYTVRGDLSSQYITGLLLALPLAGGDSTLRILPPVESRPYIDITLGVLRRFGVTVEETGENERKQHHRQGHRRRHREDREDEQGFKLGNIEREDEPERDHHEIVADETDGRAVRARHQNADKREDEIADQDRQSVFVERDVPGEEADQGVGEEPPEQDAPEDQVVFRDRDAARVARVGFPDAPPAEGAVLFLARQRVVVVVIPIHKNLLPAPRGAIVFFTFLL